MTRRTAGLMAFQDPYRVLNVKPTASLSDIRKAYRLKALRLHPDRCKDPDATENFKALTRALDEVTSHLRSGAARQHSRQAQNRETASTYQQYYWHRGRRYRAQGAWQDIAFLEWVLHPGRYISSQTRMKISFGVIVSLLTWGVIENVFLVEANPTFISSEVKKK